MPHDISFSTSVRVSRSVCLSTLVALYAIALAPTARAQFSPSGTIAGSNTTPQTLASGTGTVNSSSSLTVTGNNVAISVTGSSTIVNNGSIQQTSSLTVASGNAGKSRAIRDNVGGLTLTINNGSATNSTALIQTKDADVIQMNVAGSTVTLNNFGTINSQNSSGAGNQAIDWNALNTATGSNTLNNFSTGIITATEADAVRPGMNGTVSNNGLIKATTSTGSSSDGIDAQNNTGVVVTNNGPGLIEGGRHGITGGAANSTVTFTTSVTNNAGATIKGDNGSGINLDGFNNKQSATIFNNGTITGNGVTGDGDGIDVDGIVNVTNTGVIRSINAFSSVAGSPAQSEGITVGGGTIINSGTIEGLVAVGNTNAVGRGISFLGNDITTGALAGTREAIYGNATVTNQAGGLIRGDSDSGIAVDGPISGFIVTINNNAGATIQGGGTTNAAIRTGADNGVIINGGIIDGTSSGKAIDMGTGNNALTITGGSASVLGSINGGSAGGTNALTFDLGAANNAFSHSSTISNFSKVEVLSGKVTLNGDNTYAGTTKVGGGIFAASLRVNGRHSGGGAYTVLSGNKLGGTGTFALATASTLIDIQNGATLQIGGGKMTVETGSLNVDGLFSFDLNGTTAGTAGGYDQLLSSLNNNGTITLGGSSALQLNLGFAPVVGQQFELIDVANGGTFISGTFAGLAEGSTFIQGGEQFQISYHGGTGNDLVVTAIPEPSTTAALLGLFAFSGVAAYRARNRKQVVQAEMV